jgi:hypothetical protein
MTDVSEQPAAELYSRPEQHWRAMRRAHRILPPSNLTIMQGADIGRPLRLSSVLRTWNAVQLDKWQRRKITCANRTRGRRGSHPFCRPRRGFVAASCLSNGRNRPLARDKTTFAFRSDPGLRSNPLMNEEVGVRGAGVISSPPVVKSWVAIDVYGPGAVPTLQP